MDGRLETVWGGDERVFRLGIGELLALEDACDVAVFEIYMRICGQRWGVRDVRETLRLGLIGGGMEAKRAKRLVDENAGSGKLGEASRLAVVVLGKALIGDEPGKAAGGVTMGETTAPTGSPPPLSTETAP